MYFTDTPLHFRLLILFLPALREKYFVSYVIIVFFSTINKMLGGRGGRGGIMTDEEKKSNE